ncbi:unnamed protein product, partial [Lymnaea stagnalis]
SGLIFRLKDKETILPEKIKLAKFAWISEDVHIPNKHQQILDFICGLLVNKKKHNFKNSEVALIWRTLDKFLSVSGSSAIVKSSVLLAVVDGLNSVTSLDGLNSLDVPVDDHILCIINCACQLLTLQSVVSSQFETLCSVLASVCHLLLNNSFGDTIFSRLQEFLHAIIVVLIRCHRSHLVQAQALQTVTDRALKPALSVLNEKSYPLLAEFLLGCLLHEDHHENYAAYLKQMFNEPGLGHNKPTSKSIGNVFTTLSSHCLKKHTPPSLSFVTKFTKAFVQQNKKNPRICYLLLQYFVKLISEASDDSPDKDWWMASVAQCVDACQHCDIFSANSDKNDMLKWFFQITEQVLEQKRSPSWFLYLSCLINMNHLVVEKYWASVLSQSLLAEELSKECHSAQDQFLSNVMSTYLKLRRSSDLLVAMLTSVNGAGREMVHLKQLPQFYDSVSQMFSEVPVATMLEMWGKLQISATELVSECLSGPTPKLQWTLNLFTCLLEHARLLDHRSGAVLHQRVVELVKGLEQDILLPLMKNTKTKKCAAVVDLLAAWTMVKILLFPRWREAPRGDGEDKSDLDAAATKLFKEVNPSTQVLLSVQRVTLASLQESKSIKDLLIEQPNIDDIADSLLPSQVLTQEVILKAWNHKTEDLSLRQLPVSLFHHFSRLFPLIGLRLSDEVLDKCAQLVVEVLTFTPQDTEKSVPDTSSTNLLLEVHSFLIHPATKENARLQEKITLAVWKHVFSSLDVPTQSPNKKKRKSVCGTVSCETVKMFLTQEGPDNVKCAVSLKDLRGDLEIKPHFKHLLDMVGCLNLEYIPHVNLKNQIGLLMLLCFLQKHNNDSLEMCAKQHLIHSLSIANLSALFHCVDPTQLLTFIIGVCPQENSVNQELLHTVVHGVLNDHEAVLSMPGYGKQLVEDLVSGSNNYIKLKVLSLMVKNCQRYITKSFHIPAVQNAALELFFTVAKFVIKHGLTYFNLGNEPTKDNEKEIFKDGKPTPVKKRKRQSSKSSHCQEVTELSSRSIILECVNQVLLLWSVHVADEQTNKLLSSMVGEMTAKVLSEPQKIQETEIRFLEACCLSHLRCSRNETETGPPAAANINFLPVSQLGHIIDVITDLSVAHTSGILRSSNSNTGSCCLLESRATWPTTLVAHIDLLTALMACSDELTFCLILEKLMQLMVVSEDDQWPAVLVAVAVWRRWFTSQLLSDALVRVLFKYVYQFMSTVLSLLSIKKVAQPPVASLVQRFILDTLSDFVDLGKTQITPRMILLCLSAGVAYSLTSTHDVVALYQLTNAILVHHTNTALTAVPSIICVVNKLISVCLHLGSDEQLSSDVSLLGRVVDCGQLITRLLTLLSSSAYKQDLSKVAHTVIG